MQSDQTLQKMASSEASFKQMMSDRIALQFSERDEIEIGSAQQRIILLDQQTTNRDESTTAQTTFK